MESGTENSSQRKAKSKLAYFAVIYFAAYLTYLFFHQENEFQHWLTLVLFPLLIAMVASKPDQPAAGFSYALSRVGIRRGNLVRGLWWATLAGMALSLLQVYFSRYWDETKIAFENGSWIGLLPLGFLMMFLTAGFTEEFFFRGFLLGALLETSMKVWMAVLVSAVAFAVYHLPYAYFNPNWPSAGDFPAALLQSFVEAFPVGILLGAVFLWSRRNLLACAVLHALVNTLPAMSMIKFGGH